MIQWIRGKWFTRDFESIENEIVRIKKYEKRGFEITNKNEIEQFLDGDEVTERTNKLLDLRSRHPIIIDKMIESKYIVYDRYVDMGGKSRLLAYTSKNRHLQLLHTFESEDSCKLEIVEKYCELFPEKHVRCPDGSDFIMP